MESQQLAVNTFLDGANCAQGVFTAFCERYGLHRDTGMMICSALGGGLSHTGRTCGAVTAALLLIGLHYGKENMAAGFNDKARAKGKEFIKLFESRFTSCSCKDLLGYDIGVPEEKEQIRSNDLFNTRCPLFVGGAAEILETLLDD